MIQDQKTNLHVQNLNRLRRHCKNDVIFQTMDMT